jgi:hypothetical protein
MTTNSISPTRIIYTELAPVRGLFSFRGNGTLQSHSDLKPPLFQLQSGYTKDKANAIILVGIVKNRMFWVEADGDDASAVFSNACSVAKSALRQLELKMP